VISLRSTSCALLAAVLVALPLSCVVIADECPCVVGSLVEPTGTRVKIPPVATAWEVVVRAGEPLFIVHGITTSLTEEKMSEMAEEELCQAARDFFAFELEVDGRLIVPSVLDVRWGLIRGAPEYGACGHIEWVFEFPAGSLPPGIHLLAGRWSYKAEAELGLFAEHEEDLNPLFPLTGSLILTVLP
jgi:hypothetical protein